MGDSAVVQDLLFGIDFGAVPDWLSLGVSVLAGSAVGSRQASVQRLRTEQRHNLVMGPLATLALAPNVRPRSGDGLASLTGVTEELSALLLGQAIQDANYRVAVLGWRERVLWKRITNELESGQATRDWRKVWALSHNTTLTTDQKSDLQRFVAAEQVWAALRTEVSSLFKLEYALLNPRWVTPMVRVAATYDVIRKGPYRVSLEAPK